MFRSEHASRWLLHPYDPTLRDQLLAGLSNAAPALTHLAEARSAALRLLSSPGLQFQSSESNSIPFGPKKTWDPTFRRQLEILPSGKVLATSLLRTGSPEDELHLEHPSDVSAVELLYEGASTNSMVGVRYANRDVIVWNVELAAMVARFTNVPPAQPVRISADGSMSVLTRPTSGLVEWRRTSKGQMSLGRLTMTNALDAVPSPDGQKLATWTSEHSPIQVFRIADQTLIGSIPSVQAQNQVRWSQDGLWIAVSGPDGFTSLWQTTPLQLISSFGPSTANGFSWSLVPRRPAFITLDSAGTVSLMNPWTTRPELQVATEAQSFRLHPDGISLVLFRNEGTVADRYRIDWTPNWVTLIQDPLSPSESPRAIAWNATGNLVAVPSNTGLGLYSVSNGLAARIATEHPVVEIQGIRGGNEFWATTTRGVHVVTTQQEGAVPSTRTSTAVHPFPQDALGSSASLDGKTYAVRYTDRLTIHAEGQRTLEVRTPAAAGPIEITSDGKWLAVAGSNGGVQVLETTTGKTLWTAPEKGRCAVRFSQDGKLLVIGTGQHYSLWSVANGAFLWKLPRGLQHESLAAMDFSPDGKWLACAGGVGDAWMVQTADGKELFRLELSSVGPITELRFSPNQLHLCALQSNHALQFWDLSWIQTQLARLGLGLDRN